MGFDQKCKGKTVKISCVGAKVIFDTKCKGTKCNLSKKNLISASLLVQHGFKVVLKSNKIVITKNCNFID